MTTENAGSGEDSMSTAEDFFSAMLDPKGTTSRAEEADADTAESDELEAEEESDEDESDEQTDEEEDDSEPEDEDDSELSERELRRKVPIGVDADGHTIYRTVAELKADGLRQQDYSRKTAELAQQRKALEAEIHHVEAVKQERAYHAQALTAFQQKLVQEFTPLNDAQLSELRLHDPMAYNLYRLDMADRERAYAQAEYAKQQLAHKNVEDAKRQHQTILAGESEKMFNAHPEWRDPKVFARARETILAYGKTQGFSEEELNAATDARAVISLYDAAIAAKVKSAKPVNAKADKAPKPMPTQSAPSRQPRSQTDLRRAQQRLAKTGSVDDAAEIFKKLGLV